MGADAGAGPKSADLGARRAQQKFCDDKILCEGESIARAKQSPQKGFFAG